MAAERILPSKYSSIEPLNRGRDALPRVQADRQVGPWSLEILGRPVPSPGGRFENSPAVHCRVQIRHSTSPEGTAESTECHASVPVPILWQYFSRHFGTQCPYSTIPPLKGWAILKSPSGRRQTNRLCWLSNGGPKNVQTPGAGRQVGPTTFMGLTGTCFR